MTNDTTTYTMNEVLSLLEEKGTPYKRQSFYRNIVPILKDLHRVKKGGYRNTSLLYDSRVPQDVHTFLDWRRRMGLGKGARITTLQFLTALNET